MHYLLCVIFQQLLCSRDKVLFLCDDKALDSDPVGDSGWAGKVVSSDSIDRTYREVDFATFRHFFRKDLQEFQHAVTGARSQC